MADVTFDEKKLAGYLEAHVPNFAGPLHAKKFSDGQSNPTFLIKTESRNYVLRKRPAGELLPSAHAVDREYRVISALRDSEVPVPIAYHLCEDNTVIGSAFYLMEYIEGITLWDPALPSMTSTQRFATYQEMNRVLAALHSVNIEKAGLINYGKPGNYFERQIKRWITQYRASETEVIDAMETLIAWLPTNIPVDDDRISLVHGDFRLDNMLFHRDRPQVLALLDWELSTLGHPYADLAYQCMQLRMPHTGTLSGLGGIERGPLGIPSEEAYVQQYCQRMEIDSIPNWNFYLVFSFFRFAAILQGVKKRALMGNASSTKAMDMGAMTQPLAEMAVPLC